MRLIGEQDREHWKRVDDIFTDVVETPPHDRRARLDALCGGNDVVRADVDRLLTCDSRIENDFLAAPAAWVVPYVAGSSDFATLNQPDVQTAQRWIGRRIGRYTLIRCIGVGGMGVVYEAAQDHPRRTVALKLILGALASPQRLRRFVAEVEILAGLHHPNIAQVYEAGTGEDAPDAAPYMALELIPEATPITRHVRKHRLDCRTRLELFLQVCAAVQYLHQRGVIHRDLKPANILVDGGGLPRVIDFGVARLIEADGATTRLTDTRQLVGTLAYMSPEQVRGDAANLDTRCDVYALGVILFELLTGQPPYDLRCNNLPEAIRLIESAAPLRPASLDRGLRGDLDTIVLKSIAKEPEQRYSSVEALAEDIRRFLRHEPIRARRAGALYQVTKFARRNRALSAGIGIALVGLLVGGATAVWQARMAIDQRDRAESSLEDNRRITEFLGSVLIQSDPKSFGMNRTVREALDRSAIRIDAEFADAPDMRAAIHEIVADAYWAMGELTDANKHLLASLAARQVNEPRDSSVEHRTATKLIQLYLFAGDLSAAEDLLVEIEDSRLVNQDSDVGMDAELLLLRGRSARLRGDFENSADSIRQSLALLYGTPGNPSAAIAKHTIELANTLIAAGIDTDEPVALAREALAIHQNDSGAEAKDALWGMLDLAYFLHLRGGQDDLVEAEQLLRSALDAQARLTGEESLQVATMLSELGTVLGQRGQFQEAQTCLEQALELKRALVGDDHLEVAQTEMALGRLLIRAGRAADAIPQLEESIRIRRERFMPTHPELIRSEELLSEARAQVGAPDNPEQQ